MSRAVIALVVLGVALAAVPALDLPAFYVSFLYIVFNWVSLSTSHVPPNAH